MTDSSSQNTEKHILVFGGNGFIGAETVLRILNEHPDTKVTLVNRGKSWDWDKAELVGSRVTCIKHDREKPLSNCKELVKLVEETKFAAVLDFSGFEPFMVQDSVALLGNITDVYIYISTDSVYEVCMEKTHGGATKEEDAIRPKDTSEQQRLAAEDDYGDEKFQGEECIQKYLKEKSENCCSFVILRLADVIGPRDGTSRWWQYQVWLKLAAITQTKVQLPSEYKHRPLSFVYVVDIAELITRLVFHTPLEQIRNIANQAFNLACRETPTLDQLISDLHSALNTSTGPTNSSKDKRSTSEHTFEYSDSDMVPQIYPSVERGPIDISKATTMLGWNPSPWEKVVKETVDFYENICQLSSQSVLPFSCERQDLYNSLKKDLSDFYSKEQLRILKKILFL